MNRDEETSGSSEGAAREESIRGIAVVQPPPNEDGKKESTGLIEGTVREEEEGGEGEEGIRDNAIVQSSPNKQKGERLHRWVQIARIIGTIIAFFALLVSCSSLGVILYSTFGHPQSTPSVRASVTIVLIATPTPPAVEEEAPEEKVTPTRPPERESKTPEEATSTVAITEKPVTKATPTLSIDQVTALDLIPGRPISGRLTEASGPVWFHIVGIPDKCDVLLMRLEGAPKAQFDFELYKADECIGQGTLGCHLTIPKPENCIYRVKIIVHRGSGDFTLSAECQEIGLPPTPTNIATVAPTATLTPTDTPIPPPTSKPRPTDTPTAVWRPTPTSMPRRPTPTQTPRPSVP